MEPVVRVRVIVYWAEVNGGDKEDALGGYDREAMLGHEFETLKEYGELTGEIINR